jgi:hypothetical protein
MSVSEASRGSLREGTNPGPTRRERVFPLPGTVIIFKGLVVNCSPECFFSARRLKGAPSMNG